MNINKYEEMKQRHLQEINDFSFFVAFNEEQLKNGLIKLGLKNTDIDKIVYVQRNTYVKKEDVKDWGDMLIRHNKELDEAIQNDKTGTGFIFDMFSSELANHEFNYTREIDDTLNALGYTKEDIKQNFPLEFGLNLAIKKAIKKEKLEEEQNYEY